MLLFWGGELVDLFIRPPYFFPSKPNLVGFIPWQREGTPGESRSGSPGGCSWESSSGRDPWAHQPRAGPGWTWGEQLLPLGCATRMRDSNAAGHASEREMPSSPLYPGFLSSFFICTLFHQQHLQCSKSSLWNWSNLHIYSSGGSLFKWYVEELCLGK